jgi:hypothetical protein
MKAAAYQDPSSPTQYGSDARVDVMLEEMKKRGLLSLRYSLKIKLYPDLFFSLF